MTVSKLLRMSRASAIAWAPFGATARISSVRANPAHLPSTTPGLLRQIITETLTRQPQSRPLPEAWSYVLGQAMEEAQYRTKAAGQASAPLAAPEIPVVHSRPSGGSAPSVRPSAPPSSAPASSKTQIWFAVALFLAILLIGFAFVEVLVNRDNGTPSSAPQTSSTEPSGYSDQSSTLTSTPAPGGPVAHQSDIRVYNISSSKGIAGRTADQLKQGGYNVTEVSNLSLPDVSATTVYFGSAAGERETAYAVCQLLKAPVAPAHS